MKKHSPRFLELVNEAKSRIQETSTEEIHARQSAGETFQLIDVREPKEWQTGHLPHAIYLGKGTLERDVEELFPDLHTELVLYCGGGFRSALAAENLQRMGYTKVTSMDGGFREWVNAGFRTLTPTS